MAAPRMAQGTPIGPAARGRSLADGLGEQLAERIRSGAYPVGAKLPTETELARMAGVSRTVVREATAFLKSSGLIETRRGAGAFVVAQEPGGWLAERVDPAALHDALGVLELRLAVEVEAAALAAARRRPEHLAALDHALRQFEADARSGDAAEADLAFHVALAAATGNPHFERFLRQLGDRALPRRRLPQAQAAAAAAALRPLLDRVAAEHQAIRDAVAAGDPTLAAAAMRTHLAGSRARYAALLNAERPAADGPSCAESP